MFLGVVLGIVVAPDFDGRQAAGLRRVAQQDPGQQGDEQRHGGGEGEGADQEVELFVRTVEPAAEPGGAVGGHRPDERAADVVRAVPDAHHRAALRDREPVRHHASARRPAHAVEPAHEEVQDAHHQDGQGFAFGADGLDGDDHKAHRDGGQHQAEGQERPGVGAVGDTAHQEFGEGVGRGIQAEDEAQLRLLEAERRHGRDGHRQVFADQVEAGIADEGAQEHLQAQALVAGVGLRPGLGGLISRLLKEFEHYRTVSMRMSG